MIKGDGSAQVRGAATRAQHCEALRPNNVTEVGLSAANRISKDTAIYNPDWFLIGLYYPMLRVYATPETPRPMIIMCILDSMDFHHKLEFIIHRDDQYELCR